MPASLSTLTLGVAAPPLTQIHQSEKLPKCYFVRRHENCNAEKQEATIDFCPMSSPGIWLCNVLFGLKLTVLLCFIPLHECKSSRMISIILIAAKCYKPSLLQIYTIYWANFPQFSRFFLNTLFVQYIVLCVDTKDCNKENSIL